MEFTIERSKWWRGQGAGSQLIRAQDGMMCCLGFFGIACGVPKKNLVNVASPDGNAAWPEWLLCSEVAGVLMGLNDRLAHPDGGPASWLSELEADREARIAAIFLEHGVIVTFVD